MGRARRARRGDDRRRRVPRRAEAVTDPATLAALVAERRGRRASPASRRSSTSPAARACPSGSSTTRCTAHDADPDLPEALPHPVVDNHCHLDIARGRDEPALPVDEALALAASVGVTRDRADRLRPRGRALGRRDRRGARPGRGRGGAAPQRGAAAGRARAGSTTRSPRSSGWPASSDRVRAVGETGLDYYRTGEEGRAAQHESFRRAHRAGQGRSTRPW